MTVGFSTCTMVFIYSPSVGSEWNGVCIPVNVAVASVMACRLFRELKLGLIGGPMTEGAISRLVFNDMGHMLQQHSDHAFELHVLDGTGSGLGEIGNFWGGGHSDEDFELQVERESRTND
jgi:hypothetical protein